MKWANPYTWLGALLIVAALIGGGWLVGHREVRVLKAGIAALADANDEAAADLAAHRTALGIANQGLSDAANAFRAISTQARLDAAQGELEAAQAVRAAAEAHKRKLVLQDEIERLNRQIVLERNGCVDGRRPICGVPLE